MNPDRALNPIFLLVLASLLCAPALAQEAPQLEKITVNGVELHYQDKGEGEPFVLVHGGIGDYRTWLATTNALSKQYRVIAYSRRYNFPNQNPEIPSDYSARVDAQDLKALIEELELAPVHVVGHSYGAFTALFLAINNPELVRSLILAEPALMRWLADMPEGAASWQKFETEVFSECAKAFREGDEDGTLRIFIDWVLGPGGYDQLPPIVRTFMKSNLVEFGALLTSVDAFPPLLREDVEKLDIPTLMLSGENTIEALKLIDAELERHLPNVERIIIPEATHGMFIEQPVACNQAILDFLEKQ